MSKKVIVIKQDVAEFTPIDLTVEHNEPTNNDVSEAAIIVDAPETETPETKAEIEQPTEAETKSEATPETDTDTMPMSAKEMAKFTVGLINVGLSAGVPKMLLNSEFSEAERDIIDKLQSGLDIPQNEFMQKVQRKFMQFVRKCEEIPLTDDESKNYQKAWEKCFVKWDFKMTPETALITSTLMIVGSRFMPIIGNKLTKVFNG